MYIYDPISPISS